ncbi:MAG: ribosome biogenesis/translation initiation ATPase RLI [Candidatus Woesearchaeota archaeon]
MSRIAVVEADKCNQDRCGGLLCQKVCPINRAGEECVYEGEDKKAKIIESQCIGCGICPKKCPTNAITIVNLPEEFDEQPIHKYGESGFQLYNLPIPMFGKVVGLLGRNGIGKSTAVKILAGLLKPNLKTNQEASVDDLIEYFKGTEAQRYFEKLRDGEVSVAYKPQQVEMIPKQVSGTVRELLEKIPTKRSVEEIINLLSLRKFLDRSIADISGGELQRVAIAATVLKDANVYIFDEPTSYLDITQRIKVSRFIRSLADENTAVLVIEHDLIILDYLTDLVHLVYGKENAYGICSQPKTTKNGINVYLSGYLPEENMRFRDSAITFEQFAPEGFQRDSKLASWDSFSVSKGSFSLEADAGKIHTHDIVGVLGENGIGKTTYVQELAKLEGETKRGELRISYKPQYIPSDDTLVMLYLQEAMQYKQQLIKPLELEALFEKQLNELSGGQLQRVVIAKKLAEDADLFLLDEPSAYLDVEQRLRMSKIIRDMMEVKGKACLVVDHDLLFMDYLSERLIVFDGEPAVSGHARGPFSMQEGMNRFLQDLQVTFRRDEESGRPRVNKPGSVKDKEQRSKGLLYYTT